MIFSRGAKNFKQKMNWFQKVSLDPEFRHHYDTIVRQSFFIKIICGGTSHIRFIVEVYKKCYYVDG